jgi:RNA polymerase sigma-70 factor (ECF subfamily)
VITAEPPPPPRDEDDDLMYRLQGGERDAFEALVDRHQSSLMGFFIRHLRDPQLAEDLTQETMLRVYNQSWDYLPRGCFRGWMFRIARNLLIDSTRRRSHDALVRAVRGRSEEEDHLAGIVGEVVSAEQRANEHEVSRAVDAILPDLPEEQRITFILYHFAELSLPEIADAMEANLPTTKSRLRLAREKLRERLKERGIEDPGVDVIE